MIFLIDDEHNTFQAHERDIKNPEWGIYRMDALTHTITLLSNRVGNANGVSVSPDGKSLWVAETLGTQTVQKFDLEKGEKADGQLIPSVVYRFVPHQGWPDSNAMDAEGNIYQAMAETGRVIVMSSQGVALAKIVIPSEYGGGYQRTYNLAFQPGTNIGFITASGKNGGAIFTFQAPARGWPLFSQEQAGEKAKGCNFFRPQIIVIQPQERSFK
jgi:lactonase